MSDDKNDYFCFQWYFADICFANICFADIIKSDSRVLNERHDGAVHTLHYCMDRPTIFNMLNYCNVKHFVGNLGLSESFFVNL